MVLIIIMQHLHLEAVDLNQLLVLCTLLETRSVTRAAERLGLSQSATSHALGRLRVLFDDPLLLRGSDRMILTARAEALAPQLSSALTHLRGALRPPEVFDPATTERTFVFATADYTEFVLVPPLIAQLQRVAPRMALTVCEPPADVAAGLGDGSLDLAAAPSLFGGVATGIQSRTLFDESFVCMVRRGHPALGKRWTPESFSRMKHAIIAPRAKPGGFVDDSLARLGLSRKIALMLPHFLVAPFVIAESDLVLTLPRRIAKTFEKQLPLVLVPPPLEVPGFSMQLYWHERSQRDPAHSFLRDRIAQTSSAPKARGTKKAARR